MSSPADVASDEFWQIIADAKNDAKALSAILDNQSSEELRHFYTEFQWLSSQLQDSHYSDFAVSENKNEDEVDAVTEDSMEDIAYWVVSQGKAFYADVWENPELIAKFHEEIHATDVGGVASQVYWARFQEPLVLDADLCDEYDSMV